jgi:hypothetical protein
MRGILRRRDGPMSSWKQKEGNRQQLLAQFEGMYEELYEWREAHPEASFDEIANQVTPHRRALIGELLERLARQHGGGQVVEGMACEVCGEAMEYKGEPKRDVEHLEGESHLKRAYYYCARCEGGIFPPGPASEVGGTHLDTRDDKRRDPPGVTDSIVSACSGELPGGDQDPDVEEQSG